MGWSKLQLPDDKLRNRPDESIHDHGPDCLEDEKGLQCGGMAVAWVFKRGPPVGSKGSTVQEGEENGDDQLSQAEAQSAMC